MRRFTKVVSVLFLTFGSVAITAQSGCVGGSKGISAEDKEKLKAYILDAAPADAIKVDVNFENRVRIIGYKVEPAVVPPGSEAKVTFYWRCDQTLDDGWLLFTHVVDEASGQRSNLDWVGPLRENRENKQVLGPSRWEKGKVYADVQTFTMPDFGETMGPSVTLKTGIWKGDGRLHITAGPSDGDNAFAVVQVQTGKGAAAVQHPPKGNVPRLEVTKLVGATPSAPPEKIVIDGKADEKAWQTAPWTGLFVDVGTGGPHHGAPTRGSAKLLWDDQNLYVFFQVKDKIPHGGFTDPKSQEDSWTTTGQPMLWTKDTVEIMLDPDGDGDNIDYYELQVNPQNKVFHTQYDGYNTPKKDPRGPFGHEDWDPKLKSAVFIHGELDKASEDAGYDVEIAIPWASFTKAKQVPPKHGDTWRMNFYAMENNGGCSWSPILGQGNFHKASRFGRVVWNVPGAVTLDAGAGDAGSTDAGAADAGVSKDAGSKDAGIASKDAGVAKPQPPATPPPPPGPVRNGVKFHAP